MTVLAQVYATGGPIIYPTLAIAISGKPTIRLVNGFEDQVLGGNTYRCGHLSIALPEKSTRGAQNLRFGYAGAIQETQEAIDYALTHSGGTVTYAEYLDDDKSTPASAPIVMTLLGGTIQGDEVQIECGYYDILNTRWPRERYTLNNAPGLKYL